MGAGLAPRRDRVELAAAVSCVLGLLAWYCGGARALDRLIDAERIAPPVVAGTCLAFALGAAFSDAGATKRRLTTGGLCGLGFALLGVTLVPLANNAVAGPGRIVEAHVAAVRDPLKGPPTATLLSQDGLFDERLRLSLTRSCDPGDPVRIEAVRGAIAVEWIRAADCP